MNKHYLFKYKDFREIILNFLYLFTYKIFDYFKIQHMLCTIGS